MKTGPRGLLSRATRRAAGVKALGLAAAIGAAAGSAQASPTLLFTDSFEAPNLKPEWGGNSTRTVGEAFSAFNGRHSATWATLDIEAPPALPRQTGDPGGDPGAEWYRIQLKFDLYIIDSWDGDDARYGKDRFVATVNDLTLFDHTFANQHEYQSYPGRPAVGPVMLGYNHTFSDSIYRGVTASFDHAGGGRLRFAFWDTLRQGAADESWGIDNVEVSFTRVPAPGALGLAGVSLLGLSRRRR